MNVGDATVALVDSGRRDARFAFRFVSGDPDTIAEVFNPATGTTEVADLGRERFLVNGAWTIVDPDRRIVVIEKKRPGVPIYQLERFLSEFGRSNGFHSLSVSLNLVPSESFVAEIGSFTRIREASVTLRKPNHSFTPSARELLGQIAGASDAQDAEVTLKAARGASLSKQSGIVADIVSFAQSVINPLFKARVTGQRPGVEGEQTVHLHKHALKGDARVDPTDSPQAQLSALDESASQLIDGLPTREEVDRRLGEAAESKRMMLERRDGTHKPA